MQCFTRPGGFVTCCYDDATVRTLLLILLAAPGIASAQAYVGAAIGEAKLDERHDTAVKVFGGYQFQPSFAIEGGYHDLGKVRSAIVERHGVIPHAEHGGSGWWGAWGVAGGGVLVTQMIHELDLLVQILGLPQTIEAAADTRFTTIESEDYIEATLTYAYGAVVHCAACASATAVARFPTPPGPAKM